MKSFILITFFILAICAIGSEAAKTWLPAVTGYNKNDGNNGYAGIFNKPITGLRVSGNNYYRVHIKGKSWLPAVYGNNQNDHNNGYAGTSNGDIIDGVAIAGGVQYAVHIQGGQWLPAVNGYNINDGNNGYAGILGKPIDAIMIKGRSYATSYNTGSEPYVEPYNPYNPPSGSIILKTTDYKQYNYENVYCGSETIHSSGCLITALTMQYNQIYGVNVSPVTYAGYLNYDWDCNALRYGPQNISSRYYNPHNLSESQALNNLLNSLKANKIAIFGSYGQYPHFVAVVGYVGNYQSPLKSSDFLILDPGRSSPSSGYTRLSEHISTHPYGFQTIVFN